jgi:cholinesterase
LDAIQENSGCLNYNSTTSEFTGSENCLYLNIHSKCLSQTSLKPTFVHFHGGAFTSGSGTEKSYGPEYLLMEDVVLVTVNFRLGALGFLALEDSNLNVPGNASFKDNVMSLKWVRENIRSFGGDPENITVMGHR